MFNPAPIAHLNRTHDPRPEASLAPIAVVVIGRNEGPRLARCLASIRAADYPAHLLDLIYVDSSSTDSSVALAQSLGARTLVLHGPTTAALGRNTGWRAASAPFILFLDGDTILDPAFLRRALPAFTDPAVAGVFGARRELDTAGSLYNAVFDLDWPNEVGAVDFFGGDALVRARALHLVGGYNPALIAGEEPDLCRRMRGRGFLIHRIAAPMTLHDLDMHRFGQYWRRHLRTGHAYAEVSSLYTRTLDPLWQAESRRNLTRAAFWLLLPPTALLFTLLSHSAAPALLLLAAGLALILRTATRIRPRAATTRQALAYALHAHLQHIPICLGQLRFHLTHPHTHHLIEYKHP